MNPDELLPCPFCGGTDLFVDTSYAGYVVTCDNCTAKGSQQDWQTRPALRATEPAQVASVCKHDGQPCYVNSDPDEAHWRCGTVQCRMKPTAPAQVADADCPKCEKSGGDCGEHAPDWPELAAYWKNQAEVFSADRAKAEDGWLTPGADLERSFWFGALIGAFAGAMVTAIAILGLARP